MLVMLLPIPPSQTSDEQHEELKQVRKHINTCFKSATCFLMPYPGTRVATSSTFDGRLAGHATAHVHQKLCDYIGTRNLCVECVGTGAQLYIVPLELRVPLPAHCRH